MRLSHPDYIKLVIGIYKKRQTKGDLSRLLSQSTPANIKKACLHVYEKRYRKEDEQALMDFFGPAEPGRQFLQLIQSFETSRFKPLNNYLKGETESTDDVNVELLAWLIDFKHRPFVFDKQFIPSEEELSIINDPGNSTVIIPVEPEPKDEDLLPNEDEDEKPEPPLINELTDKPDETKPAPKSNKEKGQTKRAFVLFLLLIICIGGIYVMWQQKQDKQIVMGNTNTGCMYWAGDHYEQVSCNEERKGRLILALDKEKMKNFKKIMREDTITEKSIGKVHYLRIDGRIEYYTTGGNHPVDVTRTLQQLSPYMFEKHLLKQENAKKIP